MDEVSADILYEKCLHCPLFVFDNPANDDGPNVAAFMHSSRGDEWDERYDEDHEATPSGLKATLLTWRVYGPVEMRVRFFRELDPPPKVGADFPQTEAEARTCVHLDPASCWACVSSGDPR